MATSSEIINPGLGMILSDTQREAEAVQSKLRAETWKPLQDEIKRLVDALCEVDDDKTKSDDIIAEHTEKIATAIPSNPIDIWYPKPIHHLLYVRPLQRTEIPLDVLKVLVLSGFDINDDYRYYDIEDRLEKNRLTCLHLAVKNHHYNAARWLVQHGADCDKVSCELRYHEAVKRTFPEYIAPIAMLAAHEDAPMDLLDLLITPENINGCYHGYAPPPLHVAVKHGHVNIADHLIDQGAIVNQANGSGDLPLHLAVKEGHTDLALHLIEQGAKVNQEDRDKLLPLQLALIKGHSELALSLTEHGASVNTEDRLGVPPFYLAMNKGYSNLALSMTKHGLLVNQESNGSLPLHLAVQKGNINVALSLIDLGASVNQKDSHGNPPLQSAVYPGNTELALVLIKHGASVNRECRLGNLPLHLALREGYSELALSLMKHGASVNQQDGHGYPPLHYAVTQNHADLALSLIKLGASVNQAARHGDLPLNSALQNGRTDLALSLIEHGASVNQEDGTGYLPLHVAALFGHMYVNKDTEHFNWELFTKLVPANSMARLTTICFLLFDEETKPMGKELMSRMFHHLLQHLVLIESLSISIKTELYLGSDVRVEMKLNNETLWNRSFKCAYLCSMLLILLGCDVSFPDAIVPQLSATASAEHSRHAQSIDDLWHVYQQHVKSLQTLCIQKTRQSMHSLTDDSFQSLPVPSKLRKLLMGIHDADLLHYIVDLLCEAILMWPKCIPIEDFM